MRNASRHGADLAYSRSVACALAGQSRPSGGDVHYRPLHRYPASAARFWPRESLDGPPGALFHQRHCVGLSPTRNWPFGSWCWPSPFRWKLATLNPALPLAPTRNR